MIYKLQERRRVYTKSWHTFLCSDIDFSKLTRCIENMVNNKVKKKTEIDIYL